ncbi:hypothetical protein KKH27_11455 [bacterium]|nr:hypothetical protein [bacterium]MBU1984114.1 hypothetical protein [bacterium]
MQRSLPEMNKALTEGTFDFRVFVFHRGGEHEKARKIVEGKDANDREWKVDFVWSSDTFEKQLGGVKGLPSYYVLDSTGRVRAMIKGHAKDTLETLRWLIGEIEKRG